MQWRAGASRQEAQPSDTGSRSTSRISRHGTTRSSLALAAASVEIIGASAKAAGSALKSMAKRCNRNRGKMAIIAAGAAPLAAALAPLAVAAAAAAAAVLALAAGSTAAAAAIMLLAAGITMTAGALTLCSASITAFKASAAGINAVATQHLQHSQGWQRQWHRSPQQSQRWPDR